MKLIGSDEMQRAVDILKGWKWPIDDFALNEVDLTDPISDELATMHGSVQIRRKSNGTTREYDTGEGNTWIAAFQRDLFRGHFS